MSEKIKKILIIEDEKPMARVMELKLEHAGFEVKMAFNGKDGFDILQKEPQSLILLDLVMPEMDGFKVLKLMQEKLARLANVSNNTIINIERGDNHNPTTTTLKKIVRALGINPGSLM